MKFLIGLLLGILVGTAGTAAFLITAGGGDYLVVSSPRVRELEATLRQAERERDGLTKRVDEFASHMAKLESRFISLGARFEGLTGSAPARPADATGTPAKPDAATGASDGNDQPATPPAGTNANAPDAPAAP